MRWSFEVCTNILEIQYFSAYTYVYVYTLFGNYYWYNIKTCISEFRKIGTQAIYAFYKIHCSLYQIS